MMRLQNTRMFKSKDAPEEHNQPESLTGFKLLLWSILPYLFSRCQCYRYTEKIIREDDALYALGQFDSLDTGKLPYESEMKEKVLAYKERRTKATNEAAREGRKALSRLDFGSVIDSAVKMHMAQQDPEMLDQFDKNDDGLLDSGDLHDIEVRHDRAELGEYRYRNGLQQLNV